MRDNIIFLIYLLNLIIIACDSYNNRFFLSSSITRTNTKFPIKRNQLYANPITKDGNNIDSSEEKAFQWFDEALLFCRAGSGGAGASTYKFGKDRQRGYANGGTGGDGGNIIFRADRSLNTLLGFRGQDRYQAENGNPGSHDYLNGAKGNDVYVNVPRGTVVYCNTTGEMLGELTKDGEKLLVSKGGRGGRGNGALASKAGGGGGSGSGKAVGSPPTGGERKWLKLELRLVADIGLVGVPNAGKSTLLNSITNAKPKIANYPFTTIVPNLGVCQVRGGATEGGAAMVIADIPGLIEGAHRGIGLGRGFLRHVERCKIIIHIVDVSCDDPIGNFKAINNELQLFSPTLAAKPQIVVLNKIDIPEEERTLDRLEEELQKEMAHTRLLKISAAAQMGTQELVERCYGFLQKLNRDVDVQVNTYNENDQIEE